jgi:hypothetical protein
MFRNNRIHPIKCKCNKCNKKRRKEDKELGLIRRSMFLFILFLVVCF